MTPTIIIIGIIVVIVAFIIAKYNRIVKLKFRVQNAFSQIDIQLQRRFDLIPNLIETVKGYMKYEGDVLEKVTELRTSWKNAKTIEEKVELDNQFS